MLSRVRTLASVFLSDFLGSVFRFPFWWYTDGLMSVVRWVGRSLGYRWRGYAIGLWVRNFFVPMYGAYDWAGRLISVIMRAVVVIARLIAFLVEAGIYLAILLAWFFAPVVCLIALLLNVSMGLESWQRVH